MKALWLTGCLFVLLAAAGCGGNAEPDPQVVARAVQATLTALPTQAPVEVTRVVVVVATPAETPAAVAMAAPPTAEPTSTPTAKPTATPEATGTPTPAVTPTLSGDAMRATAAARMANVPAGAPLAAGNAGLQAVRANSFAANADEWKLLQLLNDRRRQEGKAELVFSAKLSAAARRHAQDMAAHGLESHVGSDNSTYMQRIRDAGYNWTRANETITWGSTAPDDALGWFIQDNYHHSVIMSEDYTDVGAGHVYLAGSPQGDYWVLVFGAGDPDPEPIAGPQIADAIQAKSTNPDQSSGGLQTVADRATPELPADATFTPTPTPEPALAKTGSGTADGANGSPSSCPTTSGRQYQLIPMERAVTDHPDSQHGDLNLALRGYSPASEAQRLVSIDGATDSGAPQLAAVLSSGSSPAIVGVYSVNDWNWGCGADGCRGNRVDDPPVTLMALATNAGGEVDAPRRGAKIYSGGFVAAVLYADSQNVTLAYSRDGTVANGYTVHLSNFCVDPNLLALYWQANTAGRGSLPGVHSGEALGTANGQLYVAIRDRGAFMDPRSRKDWWR